MDQVAFGAHSNHDADDVYVPIIPCEFDAPIGFYVGIIDVLQTYTWEKWLENLVKTRLLLQSPQGLSAVRPDAYAARFRSRVIQQLIEDYDHEEFQAEEEDFNYDE